ncbi:hypothetical protein EOL96_08210 [Candidatus Saccharibacteria bacterium]|nr:hypothetical protein [Candidatus Saccharibacteria bacterium]
MNILKGMGESVVEPKKKDCKGRAFLATLLIVIVASAVAAYFLGFIKLSASGFDNDKSVVVCSADTVKTYNDFMEYKVRDGSDELSIDKDAIKKLASDIKIRENYDTDPTCQTMLFWSAYLDNDYEGAKSAYQAVTKLHDQRKFADSNIHSNAPLFTYEPTLYSIDPSNSEVEDGFGQ